MFLHAGALPGGARGVYSPAQRATQSGISLVPTSSTGEPAYIPEVSFKALSTKGSVDSPNLHPMEVNLPLGRTGKIRQLVTPDNKHQEPQRIPGTPEGCHQDTPSSQAFRRLQNSNWALQGNTRTTATPSTREDGSSSKIQSMAARMSHHHEPGERGNRSP